MKKAFKTIIFLILAMACVNGAQAQRRKVIYLQTYDWAPYHFGLRVGTNFMDYKLIMKENYQNVIHTDFSEINKVVKGISEDGFQSYQILSVAMDTVGRPFRTIPHPGFSVGVIGDLRLGDYLNLRCSPTYSLSSIDIGYTLKLNYVNDSTIIRNEEKSHNIHVNCIDIPLHIKYRSKRYNNIGFYLLTGVNPRLFFTFSSAPAEWIKTKPFDVDLDLGVGLDIYNQWFKMGLEVKYGFGMLNVFSDSQVYYFGNPIEKLKNRQLQVTLTLE